MIFDIRHHVLNFEKFPPYVRPIHDSSKNIGLPMHTMLAPRSVAGSGHSNKLLQWERIAMDLASWPRFFLA